ncbi:MAG: adenylate kinase [Candidatus Aminicenantes bacterium]|nr:adenylate kinase [Candidatus Aminicenantes bacterium]
MRIVLLGAPGSGKGTVAERLERATGFPRISTGDLLRKAIREKTPLGRKAEGVMAAGGLVPDDLVVGIVRERIAEPDCRAGYILDGFPRTAAQAEALRRLDGGRPEVAVDLEVSAETVVSRLSARRVCPSCQAVYNLVSRPTARPGICDVCGAALVERPDDKAEVIRERFRVYEAQTAPLRESFRARGVLRKVDAEGKPEDVFVRVEAAVKAFASAEGAARP